MDTQTFINQVAAGDAVGAKDLLNDLLAAKAFEALDAKKLNWHNLFLQVKKLKMNWILKFRIRQIRQ